jgi:hypothetical protein
LDTGAVGSLQADLGALRSRADVLGTGSGLTSALRQSSPALSRGAARFEAQRRLRGGEFQRQLQAEREEVQSLANALRGEQTGAREFAEQRRGEEEAIARRAREGLTEAQAGIRGDIESQAAATQAQREADADLFAAIQASPDNKALLEQARERGLVSGGGPDEVDAVSTLFNVQEGKQRAQDLVQGILEDPRFAAISDIGGATGQEISRRANQRFEIGDGEDLLERLRADRKADKQNGTKSLRGRGTAAERKARGKSLSVKERRKLFDERQAAIDTALKEAGLSEIAPTLGEGLEQRDVRQFTSFDPGDLPTLDNVASGEQREQFNRISDLLGNAEKIAETDPIQGAQIVTDLEAFISNEEGRIENKRGELTAQEEHRIRKSTIMIITATSVIAWDAVANASTYEIATGFTGENFNVSGTPVFEATTSTTSVTGAIAFAGVTDGVGRVFQVRAVSASGVKGAYSNPIPFECQVQATLVPGTPTNITVTG